MLGVCDSARSKGRFLLGSEVCPLHTYQKPRCWLACWVFAYRSSVFAMRYLGTCALLPIWSLSWVSHSASFNLPAAPQAVAVGTRMIWPRRETLEACFIVRVGSLHAHSLGQDLQELRVQVCQEHDLGAWLHFENSRASIVCNSPASPELELDLGMPSPGSLLLEGAH